MVTNFETYSHVIVSARMLLELVVVEEPSSINFPEIIDA